MILVVLLNLFDLGLVCQVPAEMSPGTICTDQQMDTPDGRKDARKFAKSSLDKEIFEMKLPLSF